MFQVSDEQDSDNSAENCCEKIDYKKREVSSHATAAIAVAVANWKQKPRPSAIPFVPRSLCAAVAWVGTRKTRFLLPDRQSG